MCGTKLILFYPKRDTSYMDLSFCQICGGTQRELHRTQGWIVKTENDYNVVHSCGAFIWHIPFCTQTF